jgi:two-component system chemotaxis sensor kinase CheA
MDVAKSNVERIGGSLDLQSVPGEGARILMKIPLTLAIVPALIVRAGGTRYAIPQVHLLELVRLDAAESAAIESVHDAPVHRLRGRLIPLVHLGTLLGSGRPAADDTQIVVLQADDHPFGLVVDAVYDTEEIVVKPLGKILKDLDVFAGATILGDGDVALILDTPGLARRAGVAAETADPLRGAKAARPAEAVAPPPSFLLLADASGGRLALPLSKVSRLEEFRSPLVESAGGRDALQYRGQILPLVRLSQALPERRREPRGPDRSGDAERLHVVVCRQGTHAVGLVVERILDIVEERPAAERPATRPGVLSCGVIQGRITEFLDADRILDVAGGEEA